MEDESDSDSDESTGTSLGEDLDFVSESPQLENEFATPSGAKLIAHKIENCIDI